VNDFITQIDAGMHCTGEVQASTLAHPDDWFFEALTWGRSDSGETVNPKTALSHGPVWQAVNILAGDVGQLPLHVYRKSGDRKRERDDRHPVDWLFTMEPNIYQTPAVWKETMMSWALLWGNGCSYIVRNGAGHPEFLIPLAPDRTHPRDIDGEWWIETDFGDGKRVPLPYEDVFHVRGLTSDGFWGLSAVDVCKNVIGGGLALRKHGNKTFKNNARPGMALTTEQKAPAPDVQAEFRKQLESLHSGSENAGKWLLLYGGVKPTVMSMSNADAQWLEAMDLDREFVAGIFQVPPYRLGAMKNSAVRANLEQQNTDYLTTSLSRHLNKFKEEGERKLFNAGERRLRRVYLKWIVEAFLRGDLAARGAYYSQAKTGEWLTTNEIRELEDMNPIEGGDVLKNPAINPAGENPAPKPAEEKPKEPVDAKTPARNLIRNQIVALLEAEAKAVEKACSPAPETNLVRWAEKYYDSYTRAAAHFLETGCQLASSLGCGPCDWRAACGLHARDSLNRLLAMAGIASKDSLPDVGRELAASIRGQVDYLLQTILGGDDA
jgi:HK97 family phage portal protein